MLKRVSRLSQHGLVVAGLCALVACGGQVDTNSFDATAREQFVDACANETIPNDKDNTVEIVDLAPEAKCECVYDLLEKNGDITTDEIFEYEKKVASADDGDVPSPPQALVDAITECETAGPTPDVESGD